MMVDVTVGIAQRVFARRDWASATADWICPVVAGGNKVAATVCCVQRQRDAVRSCATSRATLVAVAGRGAVGLDH